MASFSDMFNPYNSVPIRKVLSGMHTMLLIPMSTILTSFGLSGGSVPKDAWGDALFISKVVAANLLASTAQSISVALEAAVAEALFVLGNFSYYKFLLNPQNVSISNSKLQSIQETSDLTIINTYRNTAPVMNIRGISGCTLPRDFMVLSGEATKLPTETMARYPKLSVAYLKFRQLEKFYNESNSDLVMMYDMDLYVGKLVSFNFNADAGSPWVINYDMQFRIYPNMTLHTLSAYDYQTFFDEMVRRYGKTFSDNFEGKTLGAA